MKRTRYIFLALTLVLCLGVVFTASAACAAPGLDIVKEVYQAWAAGSR